MNMKIDWLKVFFYCILKYKFFILVSYVEGYFEVFTDEFVVFKICVLLYFKE